MKARVLVAFLLAVALATQVAVAEKRINADDLALLRDLMTDLP